MSIASSKGYASLELDQGKKRFMSLPLHRESEETGMATGSLRAFDMTAKAQAEASRIDSSMILSVYCLAREGL